MLTLDGRTVVAAVSAFSGPRAGFAEFSASTGQLERIWDWKPVVGLQRGGPIDVLWASPSGQALVVYAPPGHWNQFGILSGGHLTIVPRSALISAEAAAW
jgi:hypothetical protein